MMIRQMKPAMIGGLRVDQVSGPAVKNLMVNQRRNLGGSSSGFTVTLSDTMGYERVTSGTYGSLEELTAATGIGFTDAP